MTIHLTTAALRRLYDLPAMRALSAPDRERVAEHVREDACRKGDVVFHEGDAGTTVYIVQSGLVEARSGGRCLARIGPGEWFGEMSLLTGEARSATLEVVVDCRLLVLDAAAFSILLAKEPRLYHHLVTSLSERLARTSHEGARRRSEVVLVENRAGWSKRRAVVTALAAALECELGEDVAIVSVVRHGSAAPPRNARRDAALVASRRAPRHLRRWLASRLTELADVAVVLIDVEDDLVGESALDELADTVLVLADAATRRSVPRPGQRQLAMYDRRRGQTPPLCDASCAVLPLVESWRAWTIAHVARIVTRRSVGIALGSGVAYGIAHIGVLAALERAGIPIDFIAGSSMGSIFGGAYALGTPAAELRSIVEGLARLRSPRAMLQTVMLLARDANLMRPGLLGGDRLIAFLESVAPIPNARFTDLVIPFRAVATDLATGQRVELADGALAEAMRASASAPWLLSPWRIADRVLIDGGMCDPVPSTTVRAMGADVVIAVNAVPRLDARARNPLSTILGAVDWLNPLSYVQGQWRLPNSFDVVMKSLLILQHELGNSRVAEADVLINPALGEFWFLEFWNAPALITKGVAAAEAALPAIRECLARGRSSHPPMVPAAAPAS